MPRETKFTLVLILFLMVAFGFVLWQKVAQREEILVAMKEKAKAMFGGQKQTVVDKSHETSDKKDASQKSTAPPFGKAPLEQKQGQFVQQSIPKEDPFPTQKQAVKKPEYQQQERPKDLFAQQQFSDPFGKPSEQKKPVKPKPGKPESFWQQSQSTAKKQPEFADPFQSAFPVKTEQNQKSPQQQSPPFEFPGANVAQKPAEVPHSFPVKKVSLSSEQQAKPQHPLTQQNSAFPKANIGMQQQSQGLFPAKEQKSKLPETPFISVQGNIKEQKAAKPPVNQTAQQKPSVPLFPAIPIEKKPTAKPQRTFPNSNQMTQQKPQFPGSGFPSQKVNTQQNQAPQNEPSPLFENFPTAQQPVNSRPSSFPRAQQTNHHQYQKLPDLNPQPNKPARVTTVREDETYWSISNRIYNSSKYYQALVEYNRQRVPDPKKLRPGMIVYVPDAKVLESRYPKLIPGLQSARDAHAMTVDGLFYSPSGLPLYRVRDDDTLSAIALRHLGRSTRWTEIMHLNRDRIRSPNHLKPGLVIRMPADASRTAILSDVKSFH